MVSLAKGHQERWDRCINAMRDPDRRSWILVNPTSIGDTYLVCALARAFKEKHGGPLTMVVKTDQVPLAQMFISDIDRIIPMDVSSIYYVTEQCQHFATFNIDSPIMAHMYLQGDGRLDSLFNLFAYPDRGGIYFVDMFRYLLRLDWDAQLAAPTIHPLWWAEAQAVADEAGLIPGQSVILSPDNNTITPLPRHFWEMIVEELVQQGYKVFTNMAGNLRGGRDEPIPGTTPITLRLHTVAPLVQMAGRLISACNGMAFTLSTFRLPAQITLIINKRHGSAEDQANPAIQQGMKYSGFKYGVDLDPNLHREYQVDPLEDMTQIAKDIVNNNPDTCFRW